MVDPWQISNRLTRADGETLLRDNNIEYDVSKAADPDCINLVTRSGVTLQFVVNQPDDRSFPIGLYAVSKQLDSTAERLDSTAERQPSTAT